MGLGTRHRSPQHRLARRVLVSTIDHGVESPERLAFPFDPVARVRERWLHYRAAALTILRGFQSAGCPQSGPGRMGSFEEWDAAIRQCVVWLRDEQLAAFELADPADAVAANYADDPDTMKLRGLMTGWHGVIGNRPVKARELVDAAHPAASMGSPSENRSTLADALDEIAGDRGTINPRRLGRWIERHAGRVVDGLRITKAGVSKGYTRWQIDEVKT